MDRHSTFPASELQRLVREAAARTSELVGDLSPEQLAVSQQEIVNPFLWEIGHVAFFYEAFLLRQLGQQEPLIEHGDDLYDSFTVDPDDRWALPLPTLEQTVEYVRCVLELVTERLTSRDASVHETYLYQLAVRHEGMHAEAFTYMRQTLEYPEPKLDVCRADLRSIGSGPCPGDVAIPGGTYRLGADPDVVLEEWAFVFDNEKWAHPVEVAPFEIARAPVSNLEFADFVEDGGYLRRELWSRQGWQWCAKAGMQRPIYWRRSADGWARMHFDRLVPLEGHAPVVNVGWYEAQAWCNWAGRRLPTEAEWELAASAEPDAGGGGITDRKRAYPWGEDPAGEEHANLDWRAMGCVDVGAFPAGDSAFGCRQMLGNVWEWTSSAFYPFPGYVVDTPYREYSAPWFGNRKVLRGGSWATRSLLVNGTYRNFFQPERNDIFAGFRTCVR